MLPRQKLPTIKKTETDKLMLCSTTDVAAMIPKKKQFHFIYDFVFPLTIKRPQVTVHIHLLPSLKFNTCFFIVFFGLTLSSSMFDIICVYITITEETAHSEPLSRIITLVSHVEKLFPTASHPIHHPVYLFQY